MASEMVDLIVVGAGPGGLAAAIEARKAGLSVTLLDEQAAPGGQIYRGVDSSTARMRAVLGEDYAAGALLTREFMRSAAIHVCGASVWNVGRDRKVNYLHAGGTKVIEARHIVLATGAMERPFPIPGWTLPGVMAAGAAQVLYKSAGAVPTTPVVLAGAGPLLYLLASQYLNAGVKLAAVVHTTGIGDYLRAAAHLPAALRGWRDLRKGIRMLRHLRAHKVPVYAGARDFSIEGAQRAEAVSFTRKGRTYRVKTPLVLLHQGVVPNTQLSWSLRADHVWDEAQLCWVPRTDEYGQIADSGIYIVGDSRAIVGAKASALQGRLAAIEIASKQGKLDVARRADREAAVRKELRANLHVRPFLDALYRPLDSHRIPARESVVVCRCEEVTAGQIRGHVAVGCQGPNQTKAFGRCGMGPCQGRLCGLTVTELIADARGVPPGEVGYYRIRPPIKPVTLGELAGVAP
ncbi:MAG TPA: FAD/NAD(P)-binding oxidoreductase [Caldimonas sp.]|nr:FAD/NAD(P)-binding oxidoreductase [Caldimonas sp.]